MKKLTQIIGAWKDLLDLAAYRRKYLEEAVEYHHQLFADAYDIWNLHQQADALGPEAASSPEEFQRLVSIDNRYKELLELVKLKKNNFCLTLLSLYELLSEIDEVKQWISEKDGRLQTTIPARDIEDVNRSLSGKTYLSRNRPSCVKKQKPNAKNSIFLMKCKRSTSNVATRPLGSKTKSEFYKKLTVWKWTLPGLRLCNGLLAKWKEIWPISKPK
ncbi:unnamed protein product [Ceutorhynchus assimilis]|uniref:Uncharacterized protein n=1 Tax=Ceutorhynchus assimilis TaxID=467358 RepID=A0A9N9MKR5_9CUCU|nr:unnamed protein product [Ceutorhynchus assimilis]